MHTRKFRWLWLALCLIVAACGYRFAGGGSYPGGIRSIFVHIFENRTAEVGIENTFTNDLIYEITRSGNVYLTSQDTADGIMTGAITSLSESTISRRGQYEAVERRLTAYVDLKLTDRNGKVIWMANGVASNETYAVDDTNKVATEQSKRRAIEALSERMAELVRNRLTSDF